MNYHHFAPRVGIAYAFNPKTVVRAGYGWSYDSGSVRLELRAQRNSKPAGPLEPEVQPPNGFTDVFTLAQGPPTLAPISVSSRRNVPASGRHQSEVPPCRGHFPQLCITYNVAIQRQITSKIAATGAYVGNSNRHGFMGTSNNINPNEAIFVPGVSNTNLDRPYYNKFGWTNDLSYYCDCCQRALQLVPGNGARCEPCRGGRCRAATPTSGSGASGGIRMTLNYYFLYARAAGQGYSNSCPAVKSRWRRRTRFRSARPEVRSGAEQGGSIPR